MKYRVQVMRNKRESGLVEAFELEGETLPKIGDKLFFRREGGIYDEPRIETEVYEVSRFVVHRGPKGDEKYGKFEIEDTLVRTLIKRGWAGKHLLFS